MNSFLLITCFALSQSSPAHFIPHSVVQPARTLFRGFVIRTVEQEAVQRKLNLSNDEYTYLQAFLKIIDQKERATTGVLPTNLDDEKWQPVIADTDQRLESFHQDLQEVLGARKWRRLNEIALQLWGPCVLLYPHVQRALMLTPRQRDEARAILREHHAEKELLIYQGYHNHLELFDRTRDERLLQLLEERQREKWQELQGEPIAINLRPTKDMFSIIGSHLADYNRKHQFDKAFMAIQPQFLLIDLVRVPEVVNALKLAPLEKQKFERFLEGFVAEEIRRGGALATYIPRDFRDRERFVLATAAAIKEAEAKLPKLLPREKFHRLEQIQMQMRGLGVIFGYARAKTYGISAEVDQRVSQQLQDAVKKHHYLILAAPTDAEKDEIGERLYECMMAIIWNNLTPAQQKKWQQEIGVPIDDELKLAVRKQLQNGLNQVNSPRLVLGKLPDFGNGRIPEFR